MESPVNLPLCRLESICSFLWRAASRYLVQTDHPSGTWHSWQTDKSFGKWQCPCRVEKAVGYRHSRAESEDFHCRDNTFVAEYSLLCSSASRLDHALRVWDLLVFLTKHVPSYLQWICQPSPPSFHWHWTNLYHSSRWLMGFCGDRGNLLPIRKIDIILCTSVVQIITEKIKPIFCWESLRGSPVVVVYYSICIKGFLVKGILCTGIYECTAPQIWRKYGTQRMAMYNWSSLLWNTSPCAHTYKHMHTCNPV